MPREESLALFFKTTPRLDKKLLGDFISRPDQLEVLRAFMHLMHFDGVSLFPLEEGRKELTMAGREQKIICDALRELLELFRLPGESQQINRITETFAEVYFSTKPGASLFIFGRSERGADGLGGLAAEIKSQDAVYVLSYSIIMLNTDLHSPQVRVRLSSRLAGRRRH
jgi:brefeldin A-resistance guanine nucleotide exchange factor 1